jgi:GT2 family glycosyltransferase
MAKPRIKIARPLRHGTFSLSRVDIIIPFHAQYHSVIRLMESIIFTTKSNPYHICLVDDASPNENFNREINEQFKKKTPEGIKPQVSVVRLDEQKGFAGALNYGMEQTEQPWVVFMHSDCVVLDQGWLIEMGKSLVNWERDNKPVKMISARTDNPGPYSAVFKAKQRERGPDRILEEGHIPMFCTMCQRKLFSQIGPLKEYFPCGYEDDELSFRMKHYGFLQGVCGKSWVQHKGGITVDNLCKNKPDMAKMIEANREFCIQDIKSLNDQSR